MGRLTYAGRKIDGTRAGQAVAKDLKKRFPPGLHAKAAARDPTLEIDLTNKALTDAGFDEFIDNLIDCVKFRDEQHPFGLAKLTELHLKGNKLTVHSLAKLSEVIAENCGDLRELDLSNNDIDVITKDEQDAWWKFLRSFKNCYVLQKLDLSENVLGVAGVELLNRVYMKSDLEHLETDAAAIVEMNHGEDPDKGKDIKKDGLSERVETLNLEKVKENSDPRAGHSKGSPAKSGKGKQNGTTPNGADPKKDNTFEKLRKYACTRGLRSIAYIILSNIELTNTSVGHLKRMVASQRASKKLLAYLPQVKPSNVPEGAESNKSIIWKPHNPLSPKALALLQNTESIRELQEKAHAKLVSDRKAAGEATVEEEDIDETDKEEDEEDEEANYQRRAKLFREHTRLLKRVRIDALTQEGVEANTIAHTALKMGLLARTLLLEDKDRAKKTPEPAENEALPSGEPGSEEPTAETQEDAYQEEDEQAQEDVEEELNLEEPPSPEQSRDGPWVYYHPIVTGPFHPSADQFDLEFPALNPIRPKPEPKLEPCEPKTEENNDYEQSTPDDKVNATSDSEEDADKNANGTGNARSSGKGTPRNGNGKEKKHSWRGNLNVEQWCTIIAHAVGAHGVLDHEQQMRIVYYASDWDALAYEMTIQGAEDSQQIWKYLHTVDCFTYTPVPEDTKVSLLQNK